MIILGFLTQFAAATMLLLFSVRLVQTGVERAAGGSLKRRLAAHQRNHLTSAAAGVVVAAILQSATAVVLLVVGFYSAGSIGFASGLALILGADLGSALAAMVLSLNLEWVSPLLVAIGGFLFLKTEGFQWRQVGRILLGVGLILMALHLFQDILAPIGESGRVQHIVSYLRQDILTAFLLGAVLALLMHSSLAVILILASAVTSALVPLQVGLCIMLGANFGSALVPFLLTRTQPVQIRRLVIANAVLRGALALVLLVFSDRIDAAGYFSWASSGSALIFSHVLFNTLLLLAVPFVNHIEQLLKRLMPDRHPSESAGKEVDKSYLAVDSIDEPSVALASMKREVLRMGELLCDQSKPLVSILTDPKQANIKHSFEVGRKIESAALGVKEFNARLPYSSMSKTKRRQAQLHTDSAIDLKAASEILTRQILPIAQRNHQNQISYSDKGLAELQSLHDRVTDNLERVIAVLTTGDNDIARHVAETKAHIRDLERRSRKRHLKRLRKRVPESLASSDAHLENLRALKELNAKITAIIYPVLEAQDQLLDSRLIHRETLVPQS